MMENILGLGKVVLTGSTAYGPFRDDADIDIVMCYWDIEEKLVPALDRIGIPYEENHDKNPSYRGISFKLHSDLVVIDVISAECNYDLDAWEYATQKMREREPIEDKEVRLVLFQKFYRSKYIPQWEMTEPIVVTPRVVRVREVLIGLWRRG